MNYLVLEERPQRSAVVHRVGLRCEGSLVWRNNVPGINGEQPAIFRQEICWVLQRLYLNVSIDPRPPWFSYILVFGAPLHLNVKGNAGSLCRLVGESHIVANHMMRLAVTC